MKKTVLITGYLVLVVGILATGTIFEKLHGNAYAVAHIYHSWWFISLMALAALLGLWGIFRQHLWRKPAVCGIHSSAVLIIVGGLLTIFTSQSGRIEFDRNQSACSLQLPFNVELLKFEVINYPGTQAPQDYLATIRFHDDNNNVSNASVSMNHIARHRGYRFYLSGYTTDGMVSLKITHDPWGIGITYTGYSLLLLSFIMFFFEPNSRFRTILKSDLIRHSSSLLVFLLFAISVHASPNNDKPHVLPRETAASMGKIYVLYGDRICPFQTMARDFVTKIYGSPTYHGLSAEQVLSGWIFDFAYWSQQPMFKIKGASVRNVLGINTRYARFSDYLDTYNNNKLRNIIDSLPFDDACLSKFLAADEKYNLIAMLYSGQLLKIFPITDSTGILHWYSQADNLPLEVDNDEYMFVKQSLGYCQELYYLHKYDDLDTVFTKLLRYQDKKLDSAAPQKWRIYAERLYNHIAIPKALIFSILSIGLVLSGYVVYLIGRNRRLNRGVKIVTITLMAIQTTHLLALFILRWVAAGFIPLSNGYETMMFLALCISALGLSLSRRYTIALPFGILITGLTLLVAMMSGSSPVITHIMPVLASPLLCIHVAVIMLSYALLAVIAFNGVAALAIGRTNRDAVERLQAVSQLLLYPAVFMLAIGIFVGAVWANVSWGSYWSWDPKEVWALITLIVYSVLLHGRLLSLDKRPFAFHLYAVAAFFSVLFTYFGVNYLLGGLHGYA